MASDVLLIPDRGEIRWIDETVSPQSISLLGNSQNQLNFVGYTSAFDATQTPTGGTTRITINDSSTNTLLPGASGYDLGSSALRWNISATAIDATGIVSLSNPGGASGPQLFFNTATAPSSPVSGDMWYSGSALNFRHSGVTYNLLGSTIGDAVSGGTEGSVLFVGALGVLSQNNANFFWDNSNNRLGIGNATPQFPIDIRLGASGLLRGVNTTASSTTQGATLILSQANVGSVSSDNRLGGIFIGGASGASYVTQHNAVAVQGYAAQTWTFGSLQGSYLTFETTPIGSATRVERMRLDSSATLWLGNGTLSATAEAATISGTRAQGTNAFGATLTIRSGAGTGAANSGQLIFQTASPGTSGSALNAYDDRIVINSNGDVFIAGALGNFGWTSATSKLNIDGNISSDHVTISQSGIQSLAFGHSSLNGTGGRIYGSGEENGGLEIGSVSNIQVVTGAGGGLELYPRGTSAGDTGEIRFRELEANGIDYIAFRAADLMANTVNYILPDTQPSTNQVLRASSISGSGPYTVTLGWGADVDTGITSLGGQTGTTQTFANDTNVTISSGSNIHTLGWTGQLAVARGGTGSASLTANSVLYANGSGSAVSTASNFTFDGRILSAPILRSQNNFTQFKIGENNAGAWFVANSCPYVFRTQSTGGAGGTDTGGYTDITVSANTGLFQPFGSGAANQRIYFGFIGGLPRNFVFSSNNGGTVGTVGVATWAYWDGSVWQTSGVTTGANADLRNVVSDITLPALSSGPPTTTINGITAVWVRATVTTLYTVAPNMRVWPIGVRNHSEPWENNNIWIGPANLASSLYSTIVSNIARPSSINIVTPGNSAQNILQVLTADTGDTLYTLGSLGEANAPFSDNTFRAITLNGGDSNAAAIAVIGSAANTRSMTSWLTDGVLLRVNTATRTNNSTAASGTAASAVFNSFAQPTLAASNTSVTTTDSATVYVASAPAAGINMTITNPYALWVDAGRSRFDDPIGVGTTPAADTMIFGNTTTASDTTGRAIFGYNTITSTITGASLPIGIGGRADANAGANSITYLAGITSLAQIQSGQSGAITRVYGLDSSVLHFGSSDITTIGGIRSQSSIRNTSSGTVSSWAAFVATLTSDTGGTNAAVTQAFGYDFSAALGGTSTVSALTGYRVQNPSGAQVITTFYGIRINDLTRGSTNYGIYFDGTSGLARQGIWWNADTNLYRSAANILATDDNFEIRGGLTLRLLNPANTKQSTFASGTQTVTINYTLPVSAPALNNVLKATSVSGSDPVTVALSWAAESGGSGITSLGGQTGGTQTFASDTNVTISSASNTHTLGWTGQLAVARGGTGASTLTSNGVLLGNGTSAISATVAGTANQVLRIPGAGGAPGFGAIDLSQAASLTGFLGVTYGGSGTNVSFTAGSVVFAGSSGVYSQDNTNFFWNNTDKTLNLNGSSTSVPNLVVKKDALAATQITGFQLSNTTAALVGAQIQNPPALEFTGTAWNTGTSLSNNARARILMNALAGPESDLEFQISADTGTPSWSTIVKFDNNGIELPQTFGLSWTSSVAQIYETLDNLLFYVNSSLTIESSSGNLAKFNATGNIFYSVANNHVAQFITGGINSSDAIEIHETSVSSVNMRLTMGRHGNASNPFAIRLHPYGVSANSTSEIHFIELAANGTNYTAFKSADSMANTITYVLPNVQPSVNQVLHASSISGSGPYTIELGWAANVDTGITSLGGQTGTTQTFANDTNVTISSSSDTHTLGWTGQLAVDRGGTGATTLTSNGVLLGNGTSAISATVAGTANQVLRIPGAGGTPAFGAIDLSQAAAVTGTLPVARGGTGATTLTSNGVLLGNTTSAVTATAAGTANQVLRIPSGGGAPAFGTIDLGQAAAVTGTLAVARGGTGASTFTIGSVVFAGASGVYTQDNTNFFWDNTNKRLGLRVNTPGATLHINPSTGSQTSWLTDGVFFRVQAGTRTNSSTATSGTAASAVFNSFAQPTLAATNATVTTTDSATVYIANAPAAGTNMTITNPYALWVDAGRSRFDAAVGVGVQPDDNNLIYSLNTTSSNITRSAIQATNQITGAVTSALPVGAVGKAEINAEANAVFYAAGVFGSARTATGQSGTLTSIYGIDADAWHQGSANITSMAASRALVNIANTSAGTITDAFVYLGQLSAASGGTNSAVTNAFGFDFIASLSGTSTITNLTGYRMQNPSGSQTITNLYGIRIADLTRGTNNYGIYFDGTSGLARQGLWWNADTNLYRSAANTLKTDGELVVGQRMTSSVAVLTDGATISLDASLGNHFRVTLGGNRTLLAPTNSVDGQKITIEVIQDGTGSRTLTLTTGSSDSFIFGTDITSITLTTTASKRDLIGCIYSSSLARWMVVSFIKGF